MSKKVSMKDIATELGVSVALVSYVLNGKFTNRINVETAEKIRKLAKQHNYRPNQIAKSLKSSKTYTIGLIIADISNLFYSYIAHFIEEEANKQGYNVVFGSAYEDPERFASILDVFIAKQVDGLILAVPEGGEKYLERVKEVSLPFVVLDREFAELDRSMIVNIDNYGASKVVVEHLQQQGFTKTAAIALKTNLKHLQARKEGFMETSSQALGLREPLFYEVLEKDLEQEIERIILHAVQVEKVDSLYFFTNRIAMAGLAVLARFDIAVPEQVAVVCFDEADAYKIFKREITYVQQPLKEMSQMAVQKILDPEIRTLKKIFQTKLIVKESTNRMIDNEKQ